MEPIQYYSVSAELSAAVPEAASFIRRIIEDHGEDLVHVTCASFAREWLSQRANRGEFSGQSMDRLSQVLKRMCVSNERVQEVLGLSILPNLVKHPVLARMLHERADACLEREIELLQRRMTFVWPPPG